MCGAKYSHNELKLSRMVYYEPESAYVLGATLCTMRYCHTRFHAVKIDYFFVDVISPNKTAVSETQTIHILYSQIS